MKLKNIIYYIIILLLASCNSVETIKIPDSRKIISRFDEEKIKQIKEEPIEKNSKLKVATILPLTGKNSYIGKPILNAINLALFDNDMDSRIELFIYDNKSSDYNSKKILKEIADKNIRVVLGPVFTSSIESIAKIAADNNIAILSFSNNSDLINKENIFLSGFSVEQEIERISSYLINNNKNNFSVIAPNNQYGIRVVEVLRGMVEAKDANFISSQFYINSKKDFSDITNNILNSFVVSQDVKEYDEELEAIEDKEERELRRIEIINNHKIYTDTILIADSSSKVFDIINEIKINNIDGRDIQIIGTSLWNKKEIIDSDISNVLISGVSDKYFNAFKKRYEEIYSDSPIRISSIAYDVTSFLIDLNKEVDGRALNSYDITNYNEKKGFRGIDGLFRFLPNGIIQRNLSVLKIDNKSIRVIDRPGSRFFSY